MGLTSFKEGYEAGYDSAFKDLNSSYKSAHHRDLCGQCRACVFLRDMMNYIVKHVDGHMTPEERITVFGIFSACYERLQDESRQDEIGWWDL